MIGHSDKILIESSPSDRLSTIGFGMKIYLHYFHF